MTTQECAGCWSPLKQSDAYCHGEKRVCQSCYESVDRGVTPRYLEMGRCFYVANRQNEPSGEGVSDGDRRAWRARHQCVENARWLVESASHIQITACDTHLAAACVGCTLVTPVVASGNRVKLSSD